MLGTLINFPGDQAVAQPAVNPAPAAPGQGGPRSPGAHSSIPIPAPGRVPKASAEAPSWLQSRGVIYARLPQCKLFILIPQKHFIILILPILR